MCGLGVTFHKSYKVPTNQNFQLLDVAKFSIRYKKKTKEMGTDMGTHGSGFV